MAQIISPIANLLDRGIGVEDIQAALTAATDTEIQFANDGSMIMFIDNASGGVRTATLRATPDERGRGGAGVNDVVLTIPAGELAFFPFMAVAMFANVGLTTVTLDAFATTGVGLYRLTKR